jgi:YD repeat-containing protein
LPTGFCPSRSGGRGGVPGAQRHTGAAERHPSRRGSDYRPDGRAEGSEGPDRIVRNDYDAAGQLLAVWKTWGAPLQQRYAAYEYQNLNGHQTAVIDANGNRAEMTYDPFDRQSRWIFPSPSTAGQVNPNDYEQYGYDPDGNRTSLRKRRAGGSARPSPHRAGNHSRAGAGTCSPERRATTSAKLPCTATRWSPKKMSVNGPDTERT